MLKLSSLLKLTPKKIIDRSRNASVRIYKSFLDVDEEGEHKKVICLVTANDGIRKVIFKFYDINITNLVHSRVWLHCSCPYFLYYVEVALTARGSSSVINSNGKYPKIRNPSLVPYACKHVYASVRHAIKAPAERPDISESIDEQEIQEVLKYIKKVMPK